MGRRPKGDDGTALADPNAERAVLAVAKIDPTQGHVLDEISGRDFSRPEHRLVFDAMLRLRQRGVGIDEITLSDELRSLGRLEDIGGMAFVAGLDMDLPGTRNLDRYIEILRERRLRREARAALNAAFTELQTSGEPAVERLRTLRSDLLELEIDSISDSYAEWGPLLRETVEAAITGSLPAGKPTGFIDLDRWLYGGFRPGELNTLAGATSHGKTVAASQIAWNFAGEHKEPTAYFPYEMQKEEMALRIFAAASAIPLANLRKGHMTERQKEAARATEKMMEDARLYIADRAGRTPQQVASICRRLKDSEGLSLVVIDYLQLMSADGKHSNRTAELTAITNALKHLAMDLKVTVLMLSQLNRSAVAEKRPPELYDLRDSGSIEQDSDVVMALHRTDKAASVTDLRVLKHRHGSTGVIQLRFDGPCVRFQNYRDE